MKYEIQGGQLPVVECQLEAGEAMLTSSGGMSWMSDNLEMSTGVKGGLAKGIKRTISGESMHMTTYTAQGGPGMIAFASSFPGSIRAFELAAGQSIICQRSSFLASTVSVDLEIFFQRKFGTGLFGGEGFIMQRLTGPGMVFVEIDGAAIEYELAAGQTMKIDTGHVAMMDASVTMDITRVKGFKNVMFGGEGLFLTTLTGPGKILLQSMPAGKIASKIAPFMGTA